MKRNNKKGFTIVELVIVIAVIAILSAVLIPTFGTLISDANNTARDQEAKNLYTEYIIDHKNVATSGYVLIVSDNVSYYYPIANSQINLDGELSGDKAPQNPNVIAHNTDCTYTNKVCTICGASQPE